MNILIISGGNTSERPVSLRSAQSVLDALKSNSYQAELFDLKDGYERLAEVAKDFDLFFPVLHGKEGEDGTLYQFLKDTGKPYVGSDPEGAKTAFDKILFKEYCDKNNLPSARWKVIENPDQIKEFGFPCVLKASEGGSSKEVVLLHSESDLNKPFTKEVLSLDGQFYVEEMLKGTEITVGVLKDQALPVIEIVPPEGKWFDYENKYSGETQEIVGAPSVSKDVQKQAQDLALKIHQDLKLGPYSRTDFIVVDNKPIILEANTPCGVGFTSQSLYPKMAKAIGLEFPELIKTLIQMASN